MWISRVLWDLDDEPHGNVQHIAEHGLTVDEVEDVCTLPKKWSPVSRLVGRSHLARPVRGSASRSSLRSLTRTRWLSIQLPPTKPSLEFPISHAQTHPKKPQAQC